MLAVVWLGLSSCSARIALRPMGVAALSRPRPLAAKLRVIRPSAGCPGGTSGIRRWNSGARMRPSHSTRPAFSAMRRKPIHRVRVPNSRTITSTESLAMANRLSTIAAQTPGSPPIQRPSAATAATRKNPSHRPLSMCSPPKISDADSSGAGLSDAIEVPD
ncbi:hypothetical protein D3C85_949800 [compost metagenome]